MKLFFGIWMCGMIYLSRWSLPSCPDKKSVNYLKKCNLNIYISMTTRQTPSAKKAKKVPNIDYEIMCCNA